MKRETFWKELIPILFLAIIIASHVMFTISFVMAYMHPCKCLMITINEYGEANIEMIIIAITTLIGMPLVVKKYIMS